MNNFFFCFFFFFWSLNCSKIFREVPSAPQTLCKYFLNTLLKASWLKSWMIFFLQYVDLTRTFLLCFIQLCYLLLFIYSFEWWKTYIWIAMKWFFNSYNSATWVLRSHFDHEGNLWKRAEVTCPNFTSQLMNLDLKFTSSASKSSPLSTVPCCYLQMF